jgi:pimeloyl-ACP methyl ester carboxylesterase
VLTPDLPGFGETPVPEAPTVESFADDIHTLISRHGGRAIVGGFSMGGYVLLALLRAHRSSVGGAMLIDTRADADSPEARQNRLNSIDDVAKNGPAKLIETMLGRLLGKNATTAVREQTRKIMERQRPEAIIAAQRAMAARRDQTDLLPTLALPSLVIVGAEDIISPPSVALAMQRLIPRAMLVQIANSGHMAPLEEPAPVAAAIETFLATAFSRR